MQWIRPSNIVRPLNRYFNRTELAIDYFDREIFGGATFDDLARADGPLVQINATDISAGDRFTFVQPQFDLMCSDLGSLRVARAVAASSAVPIVFKTVIFKNYAGSCDYAGPPWLEQALADREESPRRYHAARTAMSYMDADKRRYVHLVDGGVSDNLGIRAPLENILAAGGMWTRIGELGIDNPRHVVFIIVNAETNPEKEFDRVAAAPALSALVTSISGLQIHRYNFETVALLRRSLADWAQEVTAHGRPMHAHLIELSFDALSDEDERRYFNAVPTSFTLEDEAVDRLIDIGGRLLRESKQFQELLADF
jgi:NTE family protein